MLVPGSIVGHYRIAKQIGVGGMGIVYIAQHVHTGARAAIKVLTPEAAQIPEIVHRFHNEAKAASTLNHRNIVRLLDFGKTADDESGQWYIVLEYLDGMPLARLIAAAGAMDTRTIVKLIAQAAAALQAAHEMGIVHRDVKPDNLIVLGIGIPGATEQVKLLDFGIAKLRDALADKKLKTKTALTMGTPRYMPPEQLRDAGKVDATADVYSLAAIVYEMTTGVLPWGDLTAEVSIHDVQTHQTEKLDPRNAPIPDGHPRPEISDRWARVVRIGLDPDPARRWKTPGAFALALAKAGAGTAWVRDAMDVLREVADELTKVPEDADTAGQLSEPDADLPSVPATSTAPERPTAIGATSERRAPGTPTPLMPGAVPVVSLPAQRPTSNPPVSAPELRSAAQPPTLVPISLPLHVALAPPPAERATVPARPATATPTTPIDEIPVHIATSPTTLRSAASQAVGPVGGVAHRQRWLLGAAVGAAAVVVMIATVIIVREGDDGRAPQPAAASPAVPAPKSPATSALAIVTEPAGAMIFLDDVSKGVAPLNLTVPVDAEVVIRAELDGHVSTREAVRVGAEPSTVRLQLAVVPVDAGSVVAEPVATDRDEKRAGSRRKRSRDAQREPETAADRSGGAPDTGKGPGTGAGSGSGSASSKRSTYNPDDLPD